MRKFCGKCGSPLDKKTGLCPNCDRAKIAKIYLDELRKRRIKIILSVCATVIVLGLILWGVIGWGGSKTVTAKDAQSAIEQLAKLGDDFGYENALAELTEVNTSTLDGDNFFRLQQNYQGIPVYGRNVVCVTDGDGKQLAITGNPLDVPSDFTTTAKLSWEDCFGYVDSYLRSTLEEKDIQSESIRFDGLCIFSKEDSSEMKLAYQATYFSSSDTVDAFQIVIDAENGEILSSQCLLSTADKSSKTNENGYLFDTFGKSRTVASYFNSDTEKARAFPSEQYSEDIFLLEDVSRGLVVQRFRNGQSSSDFDEDHAGAIGDLFISRNNIWGDEDIPEYVPAAQYLVNISKLYDIYTDMLGTTHHSKTGRILLLFNDAYSGGHNARGGRWSDDNGLISVGSVTGINDIDIMAHEYGHVIMYANLMQFNGGVETKAVAEGFADIMGELAESEFTSEPPDWFMRGDYIAAQRNIISPNDTNNAKIVKEITNEMEKDDKTISKYGYHFSTILSHPAYLMWNGIDGTESKKIPTETLAKLWYRAMLMMPSDCSFKECRTLVLLAAENMGLTEAQIECVSEAFDAVGLTGNVIVDYTVQEGATLTVLQSNGEPCNDYKVYINSSAISSHDNRNLIFRAKGQREAVHTGEPYEIKIKPGKLNAVTISSGDHTWMTDVTFTVKIDNDCDVNNICIYTDAEGTDLTELTTETQALGKDILRQTLDFSKKWSYKSQYRVYPDDTGRYTNQDYRACFTFSDDGSMHLLVYEPYSDVFFEYDGYFSVIGDNVELTIYEGEWSSTSLYRFNADDLTLTQISDNAIVNSRDTKGTVHQLEEDPFYNSGTASQINNYADAYIEVLNYTKDRECYNGTSSGSLFDMNNDGVPELAVIYVVAEGERNEPWIVCSLYTAQNGQAVQLLNEEKLYLEVGGQQGSAAFAEIDGQTHFLTSTTDSYWEDTIRCWGNNKRYTFAGGELKCVADIHYDYEQNDNGTILENTFEATLNGENISPEEMRNLNDEVKNVQRLNIYSETSLDDLISELNR